ncbi:MAG: LysR substrate-binding domain-containing protein, partial [Pseudomonadota bacterium]
SAPSTLVHMVAAGMGVTLLPELAVAAETRGAQVDAVRFGPPRPTRQIGLVWRKESPLSDQLLRLSQTVQSALKEARDRREDRKVTP